MKTILITLLVVTTAFSQAKLRQALRLPMAERKTQTVSVPSPTKEQLIITLTILGEARGEGEIGMYAVACVIQQRVINRNSRGDMVCTELNQFSCWNGKTIAQLTPLLNGSKQHYYAAKLAKAMTDGVKLDRKAMKFADHYCTLKCNPYWAKGEKPVKIIGNHKFFRLR